MAATLSVSLSIATLATRAQERRELQYLLQLVEQGLGDGTSLSNASLKDRTGAATSSWTYSPGASS